MITARADTRGAAVRATITLDGRDHHVTWRLEGAEPTAETGDALLAATLLPAMRQARPIEIREPVSSVLLANVPTIQDIFATWSRHKRLVTGVDPAFTRVEVEAPVRPGPPGVGGHETAAFFSGGVDSFYTVLRHRETLTGLVFIHGIDVKLDDPQREAVVDGVRAAAREFDLPLIEVETDLRMFSDPLVNWEDSHGAALASVTHLLADRFDTMLIPSTHSYDTLYPLGSHPLLDPLWRTDRVDIVHDGCEADRVEKARAISASGTARRWLRVCPRYSTDRYNCGRCEKCLRTMAAIRLAQPTEPFASLPALRGPRMMGRVAATRVKGRGATWRGYRLVARRDTGDRPLRWAMSIALARHRLRRGWEGRAPRR